MRSKEIAGLAGVTLRALRHYHQIKLLPEPVRDGNGYRRYGVPHLIRLLRIKGLAAAGVALGDMPSFLENPEASTDDLLEALDQQLLDQIAHLEQQRQLVARIKGDANAPGAPPGAFKVLTEGRSASATEAWREQLTLLAHLLSQDDLKKLHAIYERMARESIHLLALGKRFDALGSNSEENDISALAKEYADHFETLFAEFRDLFAVPEKTAVFKLIYAHTMSSLNDSQRKMLAAAQSCMI